MNRLRFGWALGLIAGVACFGCHGAQRVVPAQARPPAPAPTASAITPGQEDAIPEEWMTLPRATLFVQPQSRRLQTWRKWSADTRVCALQAEALRQLGWARDTLAIDRSIGALGSDNAGVRAAAAAVLATSGPGDAPRVKSALYAALTSTVFTLRPEFVWALVELADDRASQPALELYRSGAFDTITTLDGTPAFSLEKLTNLLSTEWLIALTRSSEPALRQVSAFGISRLAEPTHTELLARLVNDAEVKVASEAAPGLVRIGSPAALAALYAALNKANNERYRAFLEVLQNRTGVAGLATALPAVSQKAASSKLGQHHLQTIFEMIFRSEGVAGPYDPRAGDLLLEWLKTKRHPHWETRAALALAQLGDTRAVPLLARRLRHDPLKLYGGSSDFEVRLARDDNERVSAARLIADLADIYPEQVASMRDAAEDALIYWMHSGPVPHANAMRALAKLGSKKDISAMRDWANPSIALPHEGDQPPMPEDWVIAMSALRYVGLLRDEPSWPVLLNALKKRPAQVDATMESLLQGGIAMLGMSLRALGSGAANGLAEWGDPRAFAPLLAYVESPLENEQSRMDACLALGWVASPSDGPKIVSRIVAHASSAKPDVFIRNCLLESLIGRPQPGTVRSLLPLLARESAIDTRRQVARAIGRAGVTAEIEPLLFAALETEDISIDAALALMLGAGPDAAARAVAIALHSRPLSAIEELSERWYYNFGYWTAEDLSLGRLFRWIDNAKAISHVATREGHYEFAKTQLKKHFDGFLFDSGPHSVTRNVLRMRLVQMATSTDESPRKAAREALEFIGMSGALMTLGDTR